MCKKKTVLEVVHWLSQGIFEIQILKFFFPSAKSFRKKNEFCKNDT